MSKHKKNRNPAPSSGDKVTGAQYPTEEIKWWREAIEGLVIAIVLALLIRGFEAEAFVIPTGSMAPTLQGRHKDVVCEQCQYHYRAGSSLDNELAYGRVVTTICPLCSYPLQLDYAKARSTSFTGDRILVNKFAYDLVGDPERFDVIVFKNPGNAKQNYIKRLCGMPGETIRLLRGDVYFKKDGETEFMIARKPPRKLRTLLQLVHDTQYIPNILDQQGLPPRWQPGSDTSVWSTTDGNRTFALAASDTESWIRYQHISPNVLDWYEIEEFGTVPEWTDRRGELITDAYAYNSFIQRREVDPRFADMQSGKAWVGDQRFLSRAIAKNWVGDLALECDVEITSDGGELLLELVEGGWHFRCTIDAASGEAGLSIRSWDGAAQSFTESAAVTAQTGIQGPGRYRLYFSQADDELRLWVDNDLCEFDGPTTYERADRATFRPIYGGPENPGDLAPLRVGGRGLRMQIERLRVYRDVYYVAVQKGGSQWDSSPVTSDYAVQPSLEEIEEVLQTPESWAASDLFSGFRQAEFTLVDAEDDALDQFFPMGDNSPQSEDARIWRAESYVERQFLIGEAVLIYWPHPWHVKVPGSERTFPVLPNLSRMGIIR